MTSKIAVRNNVYLLVALIVLFLITCAADLSFPLGFSIWVVYLVPTVLAYTSRHRFLPVGTAVVATLFMTAGYFLAPTGISPEVSMVNRTLGTLVNVILAGIGVLFISYREENRRQQGMRLAQAELAMLTTGEVSLEELGRTVLGFLCERFEGVAGLFYARSDEGFRRFASVGVPAGSAAPDVLGPDDGLLADAAHRNRPLVLSPVPAGYISYGSGLGETVPDGVIIGTTEVEGRVNAVIEVAYAGTTGRRGSDLADFLTMVSAQLGVSLRSALYRVQLESLLAETQQQAEELQAQGEELRANNDELEAQSKLLLASQAQLEDQQTELERNNAQLEEQASSLEAQRDELEKAQAVLKTQTRELEQASRYKSEFLANMSHELRTPLNSLLIMARLLGDNRDDNLSEEQVRFARTIETSGNDLLTLINDILDISKIEAGKLDLQVRSVRVGELVEKLSAVFAPSAQSKGVAFTTEVADGLPEEMETDPVRLEQVLKNFLSNAVKFTEQGSVALALRPAQEGFVSFRVTDTGPGIPEDQQQLVFEAFHQGDGSMSRKYGGTGLGLAISRQLAQLLGGDISLESTPGKGSAFTLTIPLRHEEAQRGEASAEARGPAPAAAQAPRPRARGKVAAGRPAVTDDRVTLSGDSRVILIVEDDPAFARILCDLAHEQGFQCLIAGTADEGALLARQYVPQAVILDMHLPDHTGLSVLDRIKRDARTRHIPVHIVSADHDIHTAMSDGAVGYLFKPVSRDDLVTMLEGLEERMNQRLRRVLVVEDDTAQAESIRHLLASRDVETLTANSAAECLDLLAANTFDCMVLDLNLPDMSGLDLLEKLSQDDERGFPPVIVYTGRDLATDEEVRLRRYSKSIIVKGAKSPERLLDEVTLFLHQVVSDLPDEQQALITRSLGRDSALEGRRVLVVEDDIRNIYALTAVLEPHGVDVTIARNGREALDKLEHAGVNGGGKPMDLVLMDVMMPEMDGLTATRKIREDKRFAQLPIITLTAKAAARDQQECLDAGANDYLSKPLDVDKLLSLVRVWMPR